MPDLARFRVEEALAIAECTEPSVHAFVRLDADRARHAASDVDGNSSSLALRGKVFAVKEVIDAAGFVTGCGSPLFRDCIATEDATVVRRLREAGAVLLGNQISHELTCGLDEPPTRNPWNTACYPGGSSAGAGVSVALGSVDFALGTDAAGSVRIPAAMTGTVGFKPTAGAVSRHGVAREASAPSIDNVGIVAMDVGTVEAVFRVIDGADPKDDRTLQKDLLEPTDTNVVEGLTVAVYSAETMERLNSVFPIDNDIEVAVDRMLGAFEDSGGRVVELELPDLSDSIGAVVALFSIELADAHSDLIERYAKCYHADVGDMLRKILTERADVLGEAVRTRSRIRAGMNAAMAETGASFILTPTTPRVAMPLSAFTPSEELGSLIPYTCPFNLTGQPAVSIPIGLSSGGLPIGLQAIGDHFSDYRVLQLASALERLSGWNGRRPSL